MLNVLLHSLFPTLASRQFATASSRRNAEFVRQLAEIRAEERALKAATRTEAERGVVQRLRQVISRAS